MYGFGEEIPRYVLALYDSVLSVEEYLKYGKLKPREKENPRICKENFAYLRCFILVGRKKIFHICLWTLLLFGIFFL